MTKPSTSGQPRPGSQPGASTQKPKPPVVQPPPQVGPNNQPDDGPGLMPAPD